MGILYTTNLVKERQVLGFKCNACGNTFIDEMDLQEMLHHRDIGGYTCAFGDRVEYDICLCSKCAYRLLKDYTEYIDSGLSEVN